MARDELRANRGDSLSQPAAITRTDKTVGGVPKHLLDVCPSNDPANPLNVTGAFVVASPGPFLVTGTSVTATSASFPAANQTGRSSVSIRNVDPVKTIYIVNSAGLSKAAAGLDIWDVGPNESINSDLTDTSSVFLVADAGETVSIQILEIKGP